MSASGEAPRAMKSAARPGSNAPIRSPSVMKPALTSVAARSEEHTSELQSQFHLVCRLLLEKKKKITSTLSLISKYLLNNYHHSYNLFLTLLACAYSQKCVLDEVRALCRKSVVLFTLYHLAQ